MDLAPHIPLRDTRDRLVDALGLGQPHPLRDLPVCRETLTVPFDARARIPVEGSQLEVAYFLLEHGGDGEPLTEAQGNGGTLHLETPPIRADRTFEILARKLGTLREARLFQTATVKVGLDTALEAWVQSGEPLVAEGQTPIRASARLVDHGASIEVVIALSQEGVDYHLVQNDGADGDPTDDVVWSDEVRGDLGDLVLVSKALQEDADLRVRAVKVFDPADGRADETELLGTRLKVRVRADTARAVTLEPAPILAFEASATILIEEPQASATYQVHVRRIRDEDYRRGELAEPGVVPLSVPGVPHLGVRLAEHGGPWSAQLAEDGFAPHGEPVSGGDGPLRVELGALAEDRVALVEARKQHDVGPGALLPSSVSLRLAVPVLVEPDPGRRLDLQVSFATETTGEMSVAGGQAGVYYAFRTAPDGPDLGLPAYFHKRDDEDEGLNKGVGQLALEVDLAVARARASAAASTGLERAAPRAPLVEIGALAPDTTLHVHALKAQTRVARALERTALLAAVPEVRATDELVDPGAGTTLVVVASRSGERYELTSDGVSAGEAQDGDGQDLTFPLGPLTADALLELVAFDLGEAGHAVRRGVELLVAVRPDAALAVTAVASAVDPGGDTEIRIAGSQPGVTYQLFAGAAAVGAPLEGNGGDLELATGALAADTTFVVRAARISAPPATVDLAQSADVTVNPAADG